ncbi:MAG: hypothetical protein N3A69_00760 [Leptospiraceae bacterium]|nr:hypothetical protein [Leptospiraceae bacterium]
MTPEKAVQTFIDCKKNNTPIPNEVFDTLKTYKTWKENSLIGLLNASGYYPDILIEEDMEENIKKLLEEYKKRIIPRVIF